jgi:hypothetical protein
MSVPVGFPGEHKNINLMDGSASIAIFTYKRIKTQFRWKGVTTEKIGVKRAYLVHAHAEPSSVPTLSIFRGEFKVDLYDTDVVHLCAYRVHAVRGRSDEDFLASTGHDADAHEKVDDFIRPDTEKDMVYGRQTAQLCYAVLYLRLGWVWIAVEIKAEDRVVHCLNGDGIPVELRGGDGSDESRGII